MEPKRSLPIYMSPSEDIQATLPQPNSFKFHFNFDVILTVHRR